MIPFLIFLYLVNGGESTAYHSPVYGIGRGRLTIKRSAGLAIRQNGDSTPSQCSRVVYETQCSSTDYAQNLINTISRCGSLGQVAAVGSEGLCRQNFAGEYCGSIGLDTESFQNVQTLCTSTCTLTCRNALMDLSNRHGCCLTSNSAIYSSISQLFSSCRMTLPSACPPSSLNVPSNPTTDLSCSTLDGLLGRLYEFICTRQNIEPTLSALRSTSGCQNFERLNELSCSYRNGMYCIENVINPPSTVTVALSTATASCPSTSSCSDSCRNSLRDISNTLGCCFSFYNTSLLIAESASGSSVDSTLTTISSNNLWGQCNLTPPDVCPVRFSSANGDSPRRNGASGFSRNAHSLAFSVVIILAITLFV